MLINAKALANKPLQMPYQQNASEAVCMYDARSVHKLV